ncbi:MAG: putative isomerase YddE [Phycisphaerae bacterium]|nr:putative isomerase YddE [Phycisphaerae bacterium]
MVESVRYWVVDSFAHAPYTGNPAGVVLEADGLDDRQMIAIAREINVSETAFVTNARGAGEMRLRWFTPRCETGFCGHATLAAAHVAARDGVTRSADVVSHTVGRSDLRFHTAAGVLELRFESIPPAGPGQLPLDALISPDEPFTTLQDGVWWLSMPDPGLRPDHTNPMHTAQLLGISVDDFEPAVPIMRTRDDDLIIMIRNWQTLMEMRPSFAELGRWCEQHGIRGICVATRHTLTTSTDVHSRFFAPAAGIPEDPVTGSVHGPLAVMMVVNDNTPMSDGVASLNCMQGEPGGRTGLVRVLVRRRERGYDVAIAGRCETTMSGLLRVPPRI